MGFIEFVIAACAVCVWKIADDAGCGWVVDAGMFSAALAALALLMR